MDTVRDASIPTNHLLSIEVRPDGTAFFSLPRSDNGQMITTSFAQVIAEEMDIPFEKVEVQLSPARPELMYNQLTGGSCSLYSLIEPVRVMALTARQKLMEAGAQKLGVSVSEMRTKQGFVMGPDGDMLGYGSLAEMASEFRTPYKAVLGPIRGTVMGKSFGNVEARDIATGQKQFVMDLKVPNALPTMVCRPPTFKGTVASVAEPGRDSHDARRHRRRGDPDRGRGACAHLRPVHRRRARTQGGLGRRNEGQGRAATH